MNSASSLIEQLLLQPHPEGGWYREVHRSSRRVTTPRGERAALTTIYYLLEQAQLSRWHVVESDEIWHFYAGAPLLLLTYDPTSRQLVRHLLSAPTGGFTSMGVVPAGVWQAAHSLGEYSLVGCTVSPGFEFSGFRFTVDVPDHRAHFTGAMSQYEAML